MNVGRVGLAVEQHQEAVVDDLLTPQVRLGDRVAVEEHHDGARVVGRPGLVAHVVSVRREPGQVEEVGLVREVGLAGEEPAPPEHGVVLAQPHERVA